MVQILFLILKIIGILVLALLGLALGAILCLLFVPVRYRISGAFKGQLQADFKASWLLSILSLCVTYREASMEAKLKLFGLTLWPGKEKDRDTEDEDGFEDGREEILPPTEAFHQETEGWEDEQIPQQSRSKEAGEQKTGPAAAPEPVERPNPFRRLICRIRGFFRKIKFAILDFYDKLKHIKENAGRIIRWLQDDKNRETVLFLASCLREALGQIVPRKGRITLTFGFEDPYSTGQVLALAGPFYPLYSRFADLNPVFEDRFILEGEGDVRGRIRLFGLLKIGLKVRRNRKAWNMIRRLRQGSG